MKRYALIFMVLAALVTGFSAADVVKDFRYTAVNFSPVDTGLDPYDTADDVLLPAVLGDLLPDADGDGIFEVMYALQGKTGQVASTNPGQLYGVITINGTGTTTEFTVNDTFGDQFDINPGKICGGVDVIRVDAGGYAEILTSTEQV
ncbi:MAG: hypothetical protein GKC06_07030, partial [Methanomicrobiales archaeon]|nr:hypothetical protein [Methanomicrobiales archaeon]